jgi:hypothetical protein
MHVTLTTVIKIYIRLLIYRNTDGKKRNANKDSGNYMRQTID